MKNTIIAVTALTIAFLTTTAFAGNRGDRITSGTMMFGGSVFYQQRTVTHDNDTNETIKTVSFSPTIGYFIVENIALLTKVNYTSEDSDMRNEINVFNLGLGAAFYIPKGVVNFYMSGVIDYQSTDYGNDNGYTAYGITLNAGAVFMLNRTWGLDAGVKFSYLTGSTETNNNTTDSSFNDFTLGYFGIQAFF
jgi:hypothetical protein